MLARVSRASPPSPRNDPRSIFAALTEGGGGEGLHPGEYGWVGLGGVRRHADGGG
jgi:hypothetical protein